MAIADSTLRLEGQLDFSGGMNSSLVPALIPENSVYRSVNVTFRGGAPSTRPGLRQINLNNGLNDGLTILEDGFMQGAFFYQERRSTINPCLFCVISGYVIKIDLSNNVVDRLYPLNSSGSPDPAKRLNPTAPKAYFCQAEKYLIIQDGSSTPYIFDGDDLYESGIGPSNSAGAISQIHLIVGAGTTMAYGQGRLFIANDDRNRFYAGDLAFGGSTNQKTITTATATTATSATYTLTTSASHGLNPGDNITIVGHSSANGANGNWVCASGTTGSTVVINLANTTSTVATGTGGFIIKANVGALSDILRFSETTYLDEGGSLQVPSALGRITGMIFMPVQDTGTGQGDLLVFSDQGVVSFSVSVPRSVWKETAGFQRVAFSTVGATSHESLVTSNGDIFFRSFDGLRTYRNARAELNAFGQVPISAELNSILPYDTTSMLTTCSAIVFDNRLLFTASPKIDYTNFSNNRPELLRPITFSMIAALDFTTLSSVGGKRAASYDGVWRGFDVTRLVTGLILGKSRAFAFCVDYTTDASNSLWEITTDSPYDERADTSPVPIKSILETRTFALGSPSEIKKLIRADFWISNLRGSTDFDVYWRPDEYPCWRTWHSFTRCAQVENCIIPGVATEFNQAANTVTINFRSSAIQYYRISQGGIFTLPLQFTDGPDDSAIISNALTLAGISHSSVTRSGGPFPNYSYLITGIGSDVLIIPVKDPATLACSEEFVVKNLQPQYRPQIRMPTPPEDADPIVGRPYYFGNDFQLRIEWLGHCRLSRILVLGQRQLEQYQGTDYVEVV